MRNTLPPMCSSVRYAATALDAETGGPMRFRNPRARNFNALAALGHYLWAQQFVFPPLFPFSTLVPCIVLYLFSSFFMYHLLSDSHGI